MVWTNFKLSWYIDGLLSHGILTILLANWYYGLDHIDYILGSSLQFRSEILNKKKSVNLITDLIFYCLFNFYVYTVYVLMNLRVNCIIH